MPTNTKAMDVIRCSGQFLVSDCGLSCAYTSKYTLSLGFELYSAFFTHTHTHTHTCICIYIYIYATEKRKEESCCSTPHPPCPLQPSVLYPAQIVSAAEWTVSCSLSIPTHICRNESVLLVIKPRFCLYAK